jgi:hypothetical protein
MTPQAETATISAADKATVETLESAAVVVCDCRCRYTCRHTKVRVRRLAVREGKRVLLLCDCPAAAS